MNMESSLRSAQVLKQEAEDLGYEGKEILDYVNEQAKIQAVKDQTKIEADKELALKELELKAQQNQATTSLAATPPTHNKDDKSSKLPSFIDEKD